MENAWKCITIWDRASWKSSIKDALELEFRKAGISYEREKRYDVNYKGTILPHHFYADFVVFGKIILEVKAVSGIANEFIAMAINYLKVSDNELAFNR